MPHPVSLLLTLPGSKSDSAIAVTPGRSSSNPAARHMASTARLLAQVKAAEAQVAKAEAKQMVLLAALRQCQAGRDKWSRAARLLRLEYARAARHAYLGVPVPRRMPHAAGAKAPVDAAVQLSCRPIGRPRIAGCFQCRFLARGGAVGRRGGKAHTCGGPASTEYQHWARVRATVRAQTLAGQAAVGKGEKKSVTGTVKKKVKRAAGGRR